MDAREALILTGASIRTHKTRSMLAAVGVVLGIGAVIGVVTMGAGFQESILGMFTDEFDADLLGISVESPASTNGPPTFPNVDAFTDRDVEALAALPAAVGAGASAPIRGVEVRIQGEPLPGILAYATHGASFAKLDEGRSVAGADEAIVSNATALQLMAKLGTTNLLGTTLTLLHPSNEGGYAEATVKVVGIEKPSSFGAGATLTVDSSYAPLVPVGDVMTHVWRSVALRAASASDVATLTEQAEAYLDGDSDAAGRKGEQFVFRYDTAESVTGLITTAISSFTAFIGAIGAVSLVVGLVGIANIMLVIVQDRTREIGVMKATGASRSDIMLIFLVESVAICVVGAILGIGLGMVMGIGLNNLVGAFSEPSVVPPLVLVWDWYAIAVFLGVFVGLLAGMYPAWRAAKVSPVEALRYE